VLNLQTLASQQVGNATDFLMSRYSVDQQA
jgi:hypothetical protein